MLSRRVSSSRLHAVASLLPAILLLCLAPTIQARADDPIVNCSALDIDFADSGATKECRKAEVSSRTWNGVRQSIVAKGPGYVLVFIRIKAGHNSYMGTQEATSIATALGRDMIGSTPVVSSHDPAIGFDIASFIGNSAAGRQITCFAFARFQGTVPSRGGFTGPPGYAAAYEGAFCSGSPVADSDATIAKILGELRFPSD